MEPKVEGILCDSEIRDLCINQNMIQDWAEQTKEEVDESTRFTLQKQTKKVISYGITSYGYDARIADDFRIFTNAMNTTVDPKNFNNNAFVNYRGNECIIPPNSFVLARTLEYFRIPRDIMTLCVGKSTYARCGLIINVTPLEPEWNGFVTMEISNASPCPAKIYAHEGICQFVFFRAQKVCQVSYGDRKGKYQDQQGITTAKV